PLTRWSFFFQAEDGIRDFHVTGVQTCALPISLRLGRAPSFTGGDTHSSTTTPGRSTAAAHTAGNGSSTPDATDRGGRAHSPPPCAPTALQRCRAPRDGGGAHTPTRCG